MTRKEAIMKARKKVSKDNMKKGIYILPNLFTSGCLIFGFLSILLALRSNFEMAATFIIIAGIFDGMDGRIARITKTASDFGAQYDSLADVIAFGVAPAALIYNWSLEPYGNWGLAAAAFLLVCGALRLARFNIQIGIIDSRYFNGLPIPAQAIGIASTILFYYKLGLEGTLTHPILFVVTVALALLMVSSIKFHSFKEMDFFSRKPLMSFVLVIILIAVVIAEPQVTLFVFSCGYIASGPIFFTFRLLNKIMHKHEEAKSTPE